MVTLVCAEAATVLGLAGEALAPDASFRELGMDSLTGLELRNRLSHVTGLRLRASVTTDNPTPAALARFLGAELSAQPESSTVP
jgi:acyl carrier protein